MSIIQRIKALRGTEPVRAVLWPLIAALVAYGVTRGAIDGSLAPYLLSVLALGLGVPLTEVTRSQVTPTHAVPDLVRNAARDTLTTAINADTAPNVAHALDDVVRAVDKHFTGGAHRK